jgi:sugar lactone lactonase YvrE
VVKGPGAAQNGWQDAIATRPPQEECKTRDRGIGKTRHAHKEETMNGQRIGYYVGRDPCPSWQGKREGGSTMKTYHAIAYALGAIGLFSATLLGGPAFASGTRAHGAHLPQPPAQSPASAPVGLGFADPDFPAIDRRGDVYIMDRGNLRLVKLSPTGRLLARWGGFTGQPGTDNEPTGIAVDAQGHVYVSDTAGQRIMTFSATGQRLAVWQLDFAPTGLAVDAHAHLYVTSFDNNQVIKLSATTGKRLAAWGAYGTGPGQFDGALGIAVDTAGTVYVVDHRNGRIETFSPTGRFRAQYGSVGSAAAQFSHPHGVAVDAHGNIYVGDSSNARIQELSPQGKIVRQWGTQGTGRGQFDGNWAIFVAITPQGNIVATDAGNNRVETFTPQGKLLAVWQ